MKSLKEFKALYIKRRKGPIAYAYGNDNLKYFSINKNAKTDEKLPDLTVALSIIGNNPKFCGYEYSFTVLEPGLPECIYELDDLFYDMFDTGNQSFCFKLTQKPIYVNDATTLYSDNRYFTCAEKKIIGYLRNTVGIGNLYSTKEPCYHCMPTIDTVYFLRKGKRIDRIVGKKICTCTINNFSIFDFSH